jgi:LPS sulfotransferase NodH
MSKANFVVFGSGRSGSTLLVDILNHHPQISCGRELLNRHRLRSKPLQNLLRRFLPLSLIALHRLKSLTVTRKRIYGFKLQSTQVDQPQRLLQSLQQRGWLIIWLFRRDLFRQIISEQVAHATRRYNSNSSRRPAVEAPQLTIQPAKFSSLARHALRRHQQQRAIMADLPHLTLVYEDDLKQPDDQCARCGEWLRRSAPISLWPRSRPASSRRGARPTVRSSPTTLSCRRSTAR